MIKYIGKKHLNSNFYKRIVLKQENKFVKVKAVVEDKFKNAQTEPLDTKVITEQIEGLNDYESVKEIVLYFLRNNTICEISQEKDAIIVSSTSKRTLTLSLSKEYAPLLNLIFDKYNNDRLQFLDKYSDNENIYIRTLHLNEHGKIISGTTNYFKGHNKYDSSDHAIVLTLASKNGEILESDKLFIMEYIKEIICNRNKYIVSLNRNDRAGLCIFIDGKTIKIPDDISHEANLLIYNRNIEIREMNNKQLKLEGMKWKN